MAGIEVPENLDKEKAKRLISWLVKTEAENEKTNRLSDDEMILKIVKQVQSEVKCL